MRDGAFLSSDAREGVGEVLHADRRTGVVRLLPDGFKRGSSESQRLSAKPFSELDRERRQGCTPGGEVDFEEAREGYC